jgi:hypothetical protein
LCADVDIDAISASMFCNNVSLNHKPDANHRVQLWTIIETAIAKLAILIPATAPHCASLSYGQGVESTTSNRHNPGGWVHGQAGTHWNGYFS